MFFLEEDNQLYRSSVTEVKANIEDFSFPEGQFKEECNLHKIFQIIESIRNRNQFIPSQKAFQDSLGSRINDSNNPFPVKCFLQSFLTAFEESFRNEEGKRFVRKLIDEILEALDITRWNMEVDLAVTSLFYKFRLGIEKRSLIKSQSLFLNNDQKPKVGHKRTMMSNSTSDEPQKKIRKCATGSSSGNGLKSKSLKSSSQGVRKPDVVVLHNKDELPLFIFEIKSNESEFSQGLAQLISFGITVRHSQKMKTYLNLVLISPESWRILTLPPFGVELGSLVCYSFPIFTQSLFFHTDYFIWFTRYLVQLFKDEGKQPSISID